MLNVVQARDPAERDLVDGLKRRLFPGCLVDLPVKYWTRTTARAEDDAEPWVPFRRGGGVLDDYLGRERAMKSVILGSLHIR